MVLSKRLLIVQPRVHVAVVEQLDVHILNLQCTFIELHRMYTYTHEGICMYVLAELSKDLAVQSADCVAQFIYYIVSCAICGLCNTFLDYTE